MVYKENEEVYLTLPRKDLQGLCKKHRLCTNHSKEELAKNLVIYFTKKKELSMKHPKKNGCVGTSSKLARSSVGKSKHDKQNTLSERDVKECLNMADVKKKHSHQVGKVQDMNATSAAEALITVPPNQVAEVINQTGKSSPNPGTAKLTSKNEKSTGQVNSLKKPVEIPASFQFYVRSEEGINLFVDFNTNTSDWINSLKDEVSIQQKTLRTNSWTICNEVRDARNITKSLESSDGINNLQTNVESSHGSRSQALASCLPAELTIYMDEKNETLSSSCMTCSHVQNCGSFGCLSCSANTEVPLRNPEDSFSAATKSNGSVACDSSNKIISNLDVNLGTDTTVTDKLVMNPDYISSYNPELVPPGNSLKCINDREGLSLSAINKDCSKPSENDGIDNCIGKNLILPQSNADELTDHFDEDETGHAISSVKKSISSHGEKVKCVQGQLKETIHQRCETLKRCKRTRTTDIHVDVLNKRQHVDSGDQSERPRNLRKTKTLARESSCAQGLLRRRSVRLGSK